MRILGSFSKLCLALGLLSSFLRPAGAQTPPSREIRELAAEAEALLDALQQRDALRVLEQGRRRPSFSKADRTARARLLVILGRARAELSDEAGMEQAFRQAISLDPKVRLSTVNTSPKIIAALERARLETPVAQKPAPAPASPKKPPSPPKPPAAGPKAKSTPHAEPTEPAALAWWIEGPLVSGARVRLVIDTTGVPKDAELSAHRRFVGASSASRLELTRSGTTASAVLNLDPRPFDLWMSARSKSILVARAGSESAPIHLAPKVAPALGEAWSPAPPPPATEQTQGSTVAAATLVPPAEPGEGGDATGDPLTLALTFGMILVMVGAVVLSVSLLVGGPDCDAPPGFGCSEVRVLPLARF